MKKIGLFLITILLQITLTHPLLAVEKVKPDSLHIIDLKGAITPIMESYLVKRIKEAEKDRSPLLILIDTPGGALESTRNIITVMINSPIPIIGFVYPNGSRAASAGAFIMLACDRTAMVPVANVGAAHPVAIGQQMDKTMQEKVVNDTVAYIENLAQRAKRPVAQSKKMVTDSISLTSEEALKIGFIDYKVEDIGSLLERLGKEEIVKSNRSWIINPDIKRVERPMNLFERFLMKLADPNIAYILLMLGIYGIIAEFQSPGIGLGGIFGAIALLLAFLSMSVLSVSVTGLLLILLALILFVLEIKLQTQGMAAIGAIISFFLGSIMLMRNFAIGGFQLSFSLIIIATLVTAAFFGIIIWFAVKAQSRKIESGKNSLIGQTAEVTVDCSPKGYVRINGEIWKAISENGTSIVKGTEVEVAGLEHLTLKIKLKQEAKS